MRLLRGEHAALMLYSPQEEIYSRVRYFFGRESFDKLQGAFVIVVGLGGVGSHAANMMVRSGVTRIR